MIHKILVSIVLMTIFTSCSSKPAYSNDARLPSSLKDFYLADDETTLEALSELNNGIRNGDGSVALNFQRRVQQIFEALPRGHKLMGEFDARLALANEKTGFDLFKDPSYIRLLILRDLVERLEQRVVTIYAQAWAIYLGQVAELNQNIHKERAKKFIEDFHLQVAATTLDQRVALNRLGSTLYVLSIHLETDVNKDVLEQKKLFRGLRDTTARIHFSKRQGVGSIARAYLESLKAIDAESKKLKEDTELAIEVNDEAKLAEEASRVPQSEFKNINGSGFPAKKWSLTFDDGPHKDHTRSVAKVLKDNSTKGVFFWLSNNVSSYKTIAKEIYDAGHTIASHSVDHSNLPKLTEAKIKTQVTGSRDIIEAVLKEKGASNYDMKYFRAPYGAGVLPPKSQKVIDAIAAAGLTHVAWNVDSLDWQDKNSKSVAERVEKQMKNQGRGIVLFHDIQGPSPETVRLLFKSKYVVDNKIKFSGIE